MTTYAWILRLRALRAGDALVLPEYRVLLCMTKCWTPVFVVWGSGVQLLRVVAYDLREARHDVATWLTKDGAIADHALYAQNDPVARRLSAPPPDVLYITRISVDRLNGVRRISRKPEALHLSKKKRKVAKKRPEPARDVPRVVFATAFRQLDLFARAG